MTSEQLEPYLMAGESTCIEFKQCGGNPSWDIFESFCAFLNRDGGDLFLGITDDGKIIGVPENACESIIKNLIKVMNDPNLLDPPFCVLPEVIDCSGRKIIRLHVPKSADVHRFKGVCYDRVFDADVKVRTTESITMMYLRKQNIFTERKVYQYVTMAELRTDLLPLVRRYAENKLQGHPWGKLSDEELLKSAGLLRHDYANNVTGICLAGILLLGRDDVIRDILPAYRTDALLRRVDTDRYDDRLTVSTNLLESYTELLQFGRKWLPDKFFLEDFLRISIREKILREAIGNMLMHREFTSAYCARFIIEKDQIVVDNANRSVHQGT
ncbi:MAG: putative DNA binding domain-containing protein, partial [Victivallales bacterium]|nr:putative DNA binding domain-containing protein [Victivallales bacterium]